MQNTAVEQAMVALQRAQREVQFGARAERSTIRAVIDTLAELVVAAAEQGQAIVNLQQQLERVADGHRQLVDHLNEHTAAGAP